MYGDYACFKSDVFEVTGWGLMSYYVGPKLTLLGGAAVVRQLESHVLPVGGFVWMPSEDWRIEALFPRPRIARRFMASMKQNAWAYVAGQFGGGSWSVTLEDATSTLVTYSDLRVLAGFEWLGGRQATAIVEAGYVFGRDISAFGISQFTPEDTVLLHAGLTF